MKRLTKRSTNRALILAVLIVLASVVAVAQQAPPEVEALGKDTAQQALQEVSISKFEDQGFWRVYMPIDQGVIESRRFEGGPLEKEALPEEEALGIATPDDYVLGVKASFFRRGTAELYIQPNRPLQIPGITKTISMWVVGRNFNHRLSVVVADYFGNVNILDMGKLNFSGWKRMTVAIPPTVVQRDFHYNDRMGLQILGLLIEPDLMETYGTYYVYFDDLRAYTDLFADESRDPDDMVDAW